MNYNTIVQLNTLDFKGKFSDPVNIPAYRPNNLDHSLDHSVEFADHCEA